MSESENKSKSVPYNVIMAHSIGGVIVGAASVAAAWLFSSWRSSSKPRSTVPNGEQLLDFLLEAGKLKVW
jgi:hypothetical protein